MELSIESALPGFPRPQREISFAVIWTPVIWRAVMPRALSDFSLRRCRSSSKSLAIRRSYFEALFKTTPLYGQTASLRPTPLSIFDRRSLQFRIRIYHQVAYCENHLVQEWFVLAQEAAVSDGAADNFAQHVAAAFVGWDHSIGDKKGCGAGVVGDYPEGGCAVGASGLLSTPTGLARLDGSFSCPH